MFHSTKIENITLHRTQYYTIINNNLFIIISYSDPYRKANRGIFGLNKPFIFWQNNFEQHC